jgi:hypothetical protein
MGLRIFAVSPHSVVSTVIRQKQRQATTLFKNEGSVIRFDNNFAVRPLLRHQVFFPVWAKNCPGTQVTFRDPHFGHLGFLLPCSAMLLTTSKAFPQSSQRYEYVGMATSPTQKPREAETLVQSRRLENRRYRRRHSYGGMNSPHHIPARLVWAAASSPM